jgi:hypothetical protein
MCLPLLPIYGSDVSSRFHRSSESHQDCSGQALLNPSLDGPPIIRPPISAVSFVSCFLLFYPVLLIPCFAFVVLCDQQFLTHIDPTWKNKYIKKIVLTKCLSLPFDPASWPEKRCPSCVPYHVHTGRESSVLSTRFSLRPRSSSEYLNRFVRNNDEKTAYIESVRAEFAKGSWNAK